MQTTPSPSRRPTRNLVAMLLAGTIGSLSAGCWSSPPPGRVSVSGVVKVKGVPVPDGQIDFESTDDGIGVGVARIGAGGRFQVFLRPANYRVGIVSVEGGLSPAGLAGMPAAQIRVPAKYAKPSSSGIAVKIDADNRRVALDLEP